MKKLLSVWLLFLVLVHPVFATHYYVSNAGATTPLSTNSGSPSSIATYNASGLPTGGDTVHFVGTITTFPINVGTSGTGNGAGRLILDFSGATLNGPGTGIYLIDPQSCNYVTFEGSGFWTQGVSGVDSTWTGGVVVGPLQSHVPVSDTDLGDNVFNFRQHTSHDITINGWQATASGNKTTAGFINGVGLNTALISNNNILNASNFYFSDGSGTHDLIFRNNRWESSENVMAQSDGISMGDCWNITYEGNKFIMHAVGDTGQRHNDIFQIYRSGGGGAGPSYGIIWRYNWWELDVHGPVTTAGSFTTGKVYQILTAGSTSFTSIGAASNSVGTQFTATGAGTGTGTAYYIGSGDTSFSQLENLIDTGGVFSLKGYGNVFVGTDLDFGSNNGAGGGDSGTHTIYWYNNTIARSNYGPGNTLGFNNGGNTASRLNARNNIGWAPTSLYDGSVFNEVAGATWDYNFFFNWQAPTSTMAGTHGSRILDPLFVSRASNNYALQSGSPCVTGDSTIGSEFNQRLVPGTTWPGPITRTASTVGAYDVVSGGGDTTPPTPNPATISGTPTHTYNSISVTVTTATDETALSSTPYSFSDDNGSTWTADQSSASYTWTGLTASTVYQVKVRAKDAAGNFTTPSSATAVTTDAVATSTSKARIRRGGLN